jgi:RHS repeat-associated protein
LTCPYFNTYPTKQTVSTLSGQSISTISLVPGIISQGLSTQKRFFPYTLTQTETDHLTGIVSIIENLGFDNYGNPKYVRKTNGSVIENDTINYIQKGSWCSNKIESIIINRKQGSESESRKKEYLYDAKGNLTKETIDPNNINQVTVNYTDYDGYGHPKKITTTANGISRSETLTYTSSGRFLKTRKNDQLNETTTYNYDETKGLLIGEVTRLGTTSYQYDSFGRLILTTYPDGIKTAGALQWAGNLSGKPSGAKYYSYTETSGQPPVTVWYDGFDREIRKESYGLNMKKIWTDTEYNSKGQVYRVSKPYFTTDAKTWAATHTYDSYGRLQTTVTPMGTTSYVYSGLTTTITSPSDTKETVLNSAGRIASQKINGKKVSFTYYASGLVKNTTPEGGQAIAVEYNLQGKRVKLIDPDAGTITSEYDGWGQLKWEKQAIHSTAQITTEYNYLPSGLLNYQLRNGERTNYGYDNLYRLKWTSIAGKHAQGFDYDQRDRIIQIRDTVENSKVFVRKTEYDALGRVSRETHPDGYYVDNLYDKYSYLKQIKDPGGTLVWQAKESNARGQLTKTQSGSKETVFGFDSRGFPTSIVTSGITNLVYSFNTKGNLYSRQDSIAGYKEIFLYDSMNRLYNWNIRNSSNVSLSSQSIGYNSTTGNIQTKSDLGNYTMNYEGTRPHALTSIAGAPSVIPSVAQAITYTDFKKVKTVAEGSNSLTIAYGVDEQRVKTVLNKNGTSLTRYYMGNYEEEIVGNNIRKIHYLCGGNGLAAVRIQSAGKDTLYYAHTDYQGSLTALSLSNGTVVERYAYDPWGKRRNPNNWTQTDTRTTFLFHRGYTMHEHLSEFNLINMNGRVYDPLTAMFFSPDPYLQAPENWLNYNRYGYALNNPFLYTDPDGESLFLVALGIYCLFFTDFGYDLQKLVSPVAIKIDLRLGSNQRGIGIDASIGIPQALPLSYRVHGGATYYWKNEDLIGNDMSGWETRYGSEWGISAYMLGAPIAYTYSGTTFNSKWSGKQTTNLMTLGNPLFNVKYENDMKPTGIFKHIPLVPKGDGDKYRTAAAQINIGPFGIGTNIITGDAGPDRTDPRYHPEIDGHETYVANNGYNPNSHRMGTFYFRIGPFRFGKNSENTRKIFQNQFAHDFLTRGGSKWFEVLDLKPRWYWGFGYSGGGTLW